MSDPLHHFVLSRTLWTIVAAPMLGFACHLAGRFRRASAAGGGSWARAIGVGSVALSGFATAMHVARIARASEGARALYQPLAWGGSAGPLVSGFDLALDRYSGFGCSLACSVGLAAAWFIATRPLAERGWQVWAWLELALGAALLSFLAGGFVTMSLGWGLAAAAGAWLAGWTDRRAGAVRATRGALGIMALLVGALLLSPDVNLSFSEIGTLLAGASSAGNGDDPTLALILFLVAVAVTSASTPPAGAPLALSAVASGATTAALGPLLLLRLRFIVPLVAGAGGLIAVAGGLMLIVAGLRCLAAPRGPMRWLALIGGAPAGLTCISLGTDGAEGAVLVLASAGVVAASLPFTAIARGLSVGDVVPKRTGVDDFLLLDEFERAGALLMNFEHWVVDAIAGALGVLLHASAWALARFDAVVVGAPTDALAMRAVRLERRVAPMLGGSPARIAWAAMFVLGLAAITHALWSAR